MQSERRIYRAGDNGGQRTGHRRTRHEDGPARPTRQRRRSPILALLVLAVLAAVIIGIGVAARDHGLSGSLDGTGTFRLLPITTTTTS